MQGYDEEKEIYQHSQQSVVLSTHNNTLPAASSGVPPRLRGICVNDSGAVVSGDFAAPGMPKATFLPAISIVAPASFAAVNLFTAKEG